MSHPPQVRHKQKEVENHDKEEEIAVAERRREKKRLRK